MARDRQAPREPFDAEDFNRDLLGLLTKHRLLAITVNVMVPLDRHNHHVMRAEAGVTQLEIDILDHSARSRTPVTGGL